MSDISVIEMLSMLGARHSAPPVVLVSGSTDVSLTVCAMRLGAFEFLPKPVQPEQLISVVERAVARDRKLCTTRAELCDLHRLYLALSPREKFILRCIVGGQGNKTIAPRIGVSERTIKFHRARLIWKMNVSSVAHLVRMAARLGLVT